ncbi:MAG TPA: Imm7 family immunity protein [Acidothermaceae bacterium]
MFEWHGWASVFGSPTADDGPEADQRDRLAKQQVNDLIDTRENVNNEVTDARIANGALHVWLAGSHNRRDSSPLDLFKEIARLAPGSYGVMYTVDFDTDSGWQRWVMRRGSVYAEADASLSPTIPMTEDEYPESR